EYYKEPEKCFKERIIPNDSKKSQGEDSTESGDLISYPNGVQSEPSSYNRDEKKEKEEKCRYSPNLLITSDNIDNIASDTDKLKDIRKETWTATTITEN